MDSSSSTTSIERLEGIKGIKIRSQARLQPTHAQYLAPEKRLEPFGRTVYPRRVQRRSNDAIRPVTIPFFLSGNNLKPKYGGPFAGLVDKVPMSGDAAKETVFMSIRAAASNKWLIENSIARI